MIKLDIEKGPHLLLAYRIEDILLKNRTRLRINYAAVAAAITARSKLLKPVHSRTGRTVTTLSKAH